MKAGLYGGGLIDYALSSPRSFQEVDLDLRSLTIKTTRTRRSVKRKSELLLCCFELGIDPIDSKSRFNSKTDRLFHIYMC